MKQKLNSHFFYLDNYANKSFNEDEERGDLINELKKINPMSCLTDCDNRKSPKAQH